MASMVRSSSVFSARRDITTHSVSPFFRKVHVVLRVSYMFHIFLIFAGARLMGVAPPCGLGDSIAHKGVAPPEELKKDCFRNNVALIEQLGEDDFGKELMAQTVADAKLGRMSWPAPGVAVVV